MLMPRTLRAFIAIPIPEPVTAFLQHIQGQLQTRQLDCRWPAAANIHLTLVFLGNIEPTLVTDIAARMNTIAKRHSSFSLRACGAGVFPNLRRARVVWVGLAGDIDRLRHLQAGLESVLTPERSDQASRDFRPHLTIGRIRRRIKATIVDTSLAPLRALASDPFKVDQVVLYQSILKPVGAQYKRLHRAHLAN
jgi:2'-5' RNA ligase